MGAEQDTLFHSESAGTKFFRKRHTVTVAFAIGILLFLLPFAEIKCNSVSLARNTGLGIATGSNWKLSKYSESSAFFSQAIFKDGKSPSSRLSDGPNIFAIAALAAGLTGLLFSFSYIKTRSLICLSSGILASIMLIAMMIQMRLSMKSGTKKGSSKEILDLDMGSILSVSFTSWFYISIVVFAIAAFLGYKHYKIEMEDAIRNSYDFEFQRQEFNKEIADIGNITSL
jgi:hypothetical protein